MLTLVLILAAFGLLILFSASEYNGRVRFHDSAYYFKKQLFATALGLGAMYLVSSIDYHFFVRLAPAAYLLSMLLSTAVLLFGQEINGSKRWLNLGPLSFQPSEFAKVSVVLFLTWQIERSHKRTDGFWFMCRTMLTLLPIVGLVGSNNLSTAIIILGISFSLVPAALWPSVPKIMETRYLGSAYSLIFWIQNIGLCLFPAVIGYALKFSNPGHVDGTAYNYTLPMVIFASCGIAAMLLGLWLKAEDRKKNYGLELPNIKK